MTPGCPTAHPKPASPRRTTAVLLVLGLALSTAVGLLAIALTPHGGLDRGVPLTGEPPPFACVVQAVRSVRCVKNVKTIQKPDHYSCAYDCGDGSGEVLVYPGTADKPSFLRLRVYEAGRFDKDRIAKIRQVIDDLYAAIGHDCGALPPQSQVHETCKGEGC